MFKYFQNDFSFKGILDRKIKEDIFSFIGCHSLFYRSDNYDKFTENIKILIQKY